MDWNEIYKSKGKVQQSPSRHISDLVPLLKSSGVINVFDQGCGTGRHLIYLFEQGFDVYGSDYSPEAVEISRMQLPLNIKYHVFVSDMSLINYPDGFFNCVISSHVIQHALKPKRDKAIYELKRVVSKKGYVFVRTISRKQYGYNMGKKLEEDTFVDIPGLPDSSTPHHYFSKEELESYFSDFNIERLYHISNPPSNKLWDNGLEEFVLLAKRV